MSIRSLISTAGALAIVAGAPMTLAAQDAEADFRADAAFVSQVAASNLLEVRLGEIAQDKTQSLLVRQYGAKMVNDHRDSQEQWKDLAEKHDVEFRADLSSEQEQQLERLRDLPDREFDVAYMNQMVENHQDNLNTFTAQGRSARSADTRQLVERGIQTISEHLRLATQIQSQLGGADVAARPDTQAAAGAPTPWGDVQPERRRPAQDDRDDEEDREQTEVAGAAGARVEGDIAGKDAEFVRNVKAHHFLEQELGELAARKAQNEQVREYGRKAAEDHAELERRWIRMANDNGMSLEPGMGSEHRKKLTKLEKKSDRSFDREYMSMQVSNHKGYLNALMKEGREANSSDVRELVERFIETEMDHFNQAKRVGARVGADVDAELRVTSEK